MTQYVKFSSEEQIFGTKNLLESQASILTSMQHLENYRSLRAEELRLKILLKKIMEEAKENLNLLDKTLPESPSKKADKEKKEKSEIIEPAVEIHKKPKETKVIRMTSNEKEEPSYIEKELEEIRRKISRLS
ncbi:MAG: hypothetical protein Q8L29_04575 [archaeon]|nr:hypothetical protein [archaeon]